MSTKAHEHAITNSKSLFTAVLYDNVPESSTSSSTGEAGSCSTYLKRLTREHLARASMEEVESSDIGSQNSESMTRVAQLTEKVRRAFSEANGNPADGRWIFISELLRLHSTGRGKRWIGTNMGARAPEVPKHLCIIPKTSDEWHDIERKRKEEEDVKSKVQRWITAAEFEPLTPETTMAQEPPVVGENPSAQALSTASGKSPNRHKPKQPTIKAVFNPSGPAFLSSNIGFTVVKRSSTIVKGKPNVGVPQPSLSPPPPLSPAVSLPEPHNYKPDVASGSRPPPIGDCGEQPTTSVHNIAGDPDTSFLPPSFPDSQVETSTPLPGRDDGAQKPAPILSEFHLSSLPYSPHVMKAQYRSRSIRSSPPLHSPASPHSHNGSTRKRRGSQSQEGEPVPKRTRVVEEFDRSSSPSEPPPNIEEAPSTPPHKNLPRLTELLASTGRHKRTIHKKKRDCKPPTASLSPKENIPEAVRPDPVTELEELEPRGFPGEPTPPTKSAPPPVSDPIPECVPGNGTLMPLNYDEIPLTEPPPEVTGSYQVPETPSKKNYFPPVDPEELAPLTDLVAEVELQPADGQGSVEVSLAQESRLRVPDPPKSPKFDPFRFPSAGPDSPPSNLEETSYNLYGLDDFDHPSPAKSLSSLACSDSESESGGEEERTAKKFTIPKDLHLLDSKFEPQFTSTQKSGLNSNLAPGAVSDASLVTDNLEWANAKLPPTSQLRAEVNSQVDEFDKFMEADLGYDF